MIWLPLFSAVLLTLSYPIFNLNFLAWFALIPLLIAVRGEKPLEAFFTGYITGVLFFASALYWVSYVAIIGEIVLALYLALYFGLFALGADILLMQFPRPRIRYAFLVSTLWVGLEYIRSHLLTGFGWALLGHTQWENIPILQMADMTGAYGISFLVVFTNALLASKIKKKIKGLVPEPRYLALLVIMLVTVSIYGYFRMDEKFRGDIITVSVVQGNIPQVQKWDEKYADDILKQYVSLTREAAKDKPNLIIWPETSVPGFLETDQKIFDTVSGLAKEVNAYLLVGTPSEATPDRGPYFNSAVLFSNEGTVVKRYDKMHLVPFGEYVPFGDNMFSFVKTRYDMGEDYSPGGDYTIFEVPLELGKGKKVRFGVLICFEDIFPELVAGSVANGADFMVVITNDAWFMKTGAPYQHAQSSVFRAVENRINVVRCANTGYSCFIDQKGRITGSVKDAKGEKIFVPGFATGKVVPLKKETFYFKHGDLFAWACIWVFLFDLTLYFIYNYIKLRRKNWKKSTT